MNKLRFVYDDIITDLPLKSVITKEEFEAQLNSELKPFIEQINSEEGYVKAISFNNQTFINKYSIEGISKELCDTLRSYQYSCNNSSSPE